MSAFLPAIVPVSLIILIGFIAGRTLALERQTLSSLTVYVLSPALIADSLYQASLSLGSTTDLVIGYVVTVFLLFLLGWGVGKILNLSPSFRRSLIATTVFPNTGNLGLPLITFALGAAGLERAVVYLIASSIFIYTVCPALLTGEGINYGLRLTLKLPLIWAMLGGLCLRLLGVELPLRMGEGIHQLGMAAIPVALVMLGMQLADTELKVGKGEVLAAVLRLIGGPAIAYAVGRVLGLEELSLQVLVLQSAMPTAVNTYVLVAEFGGDAPRVARAIVFSTLMSFIVLPLVMWVVIG